jgi:hypothetical protein
MRKRLAAVGTRLAPVHELASASVTTSASVPHLHFHLISAVLPLAGALHRIPHYHTTRHHHPLHPTSPHYTRDFDKPSPSHKKTLQNPKIYGILYFVKPFVILLTYLALCCILTTCQCRVYCYQGVHNRYITQGT